VIPETVIQDVKQRIDAAAVFGRHVELRKNGTGFVASCPFHEDRTPSFRVYPDQARFHCYGCGARGDVFAFLQRLSGKPFPTVVRGLAGELGITVPDNGPEDPAHRDRAKVIAACATAQERFESALWSPAGEPGRAYLRARGVSVGTARAMHLGFASGELRSAAGGAETSEGQRGFLLAGLLAERDGALSERFQDRVTIPLRGGDGRVLGFAGRAVRPGTVPPYLTTPENAAFKHSQVLFGMGEAAATVRRTGRALFLAGYFDVLACREAGVTNAVGGSPLTARHVETLRRHGARGITLLVPLQRPFEASTDFAAAIFSSGVTLLIAPLPESTQERASAESFVRTHGRAALEALGAAAMPLSEYLMEQAITLHARGAGRRGDLEGKLAAVAWLARYTAAMPHGLERNVLERCIAQRLQLTLRAVRGAARELEVAPRPPAVQRRRHASARRRRW
jgi:DNA primase